MGKKYCKRNRQLWENQGPQFYFSQGRCKTEMWVFLTQSASFILNDRDAGRVFLALSPSFNSQDLGAEPLCFSSIFSFLYPPPPLTGSSSPPHTLFSFLNVSHLLPPPHPCSCCSKSSMESKFPGQEGLCSGTDRGREEQRNMGRRKLLQSLEETFSHVFIPNLRVPAKCYCTSRKKGMHE